MIPNYEGVEGLELFSGPAHIDAYRSMLLAKTADQARFIVKLMGEHKFSVLELCCGNGRLLIALAGLRMLKYADGIDASSSRIKFALDWVEDFNKGRSFGTECRFHTGDVSSPVPKPWSYDVGVCITGALQYFEYWTALDILKRMITKNNIRVVVLELYNIPHERKEMLAAGNNRLRLWEELPLEDPFIYYLNDFTYYPDLNMMDHGKVFIGRDGGIDGGRIERLHYYTPDKVSKLVQEAGFEFVEIFSDWKGHDYYERADQMIVIGRL